MKVLNYLNAFVPEAKITNYLLSFTHPDGSSKARFFTQFGFSATNWQAFAAALVRHAADHNVVEVEDTPFGTKYVVEGPLTAPDGRMPVIRSVWFVPTGATIPHLATAYPVKGRRR
jgi:hypothetical protein